MKIRKIIMTAVTCAVFAVPTEVNTDFKSYMDYRCITDTSSPQYKLQRECITDDNGLRKKGDYYIIAVGTYYSETVGDCFEITLDSGESFLAMVGDIKDDSHTDRLNRYRPMSNGRGNVVEFVVDTKKLPKKVKNWGSVSAIPEFAGEIEKIESVSYTDNHE